MVENFSQSGRKYKKGQSYIMAEDIEAQFRSLNGDKIAMSYPFETIGRPYKGEDLTNK